MPRAPLEEQTLTEAARMLADYGPATPAYDLSVSRVARAVGLSRTELYRGWPTGATLEEALLVAQAESSPAAESFRALSVDRRLDEIDATVIGHPTAITAAVARAVATSARPGTAARSHVAAAQAHELDRFASWIARHLAARGRRLHDHLTVHDLAAIVHSLVEGALLLECGDPGDRVAPLSHLGTWLEHVVRASTVDGVDERVHVEGVGPADRDELTAPGPRVDGPDESPPGVQAGSHGHRRLVVERLLHAAATGQLAEVSVETRYVPLESLSRRVGVSSRSLRAIWPTAGDFNAALIDHGFAAYNEALVAQLGDLQDVAFGRRRERYADVFVPAFHGSLVATAAPSGMPFAMFRAFWSRRHRHRLGRALTRLVTSTGTHQLGLLNGVGFQLAAGITPWSFSTASISYLLGSGRLARATPEVLDRSVTPDGVRMPLLGYGVHLLGASMVIPQIGRSSETGSPTHRGK